MNKFCLLSKVFLIAYCIYGISYSAFSQGGQKWSTSGNTLSSSDFLGSTNSSPLVFKTLNIERFRITPSGNFGIGVNNPINKFEVLGNSLFNGNVNITGSLIINGGYALTSLISDTIFTTRIISPSGVIEFGDSSISLDPENNKIYTLKNNFLSGLGIGYFTIATGRHSCAIGEGVSTSAERSYLIGCGTAPYNSDGVTNTNYLINTIPFSFMVGFKSNIPTLFVGPADGAGTSGNVGIGTTNPQHKLSVNGTVQAKEVLVNTGWSDFVFENDYNLMSLSELEIFIKENKHLPEIPTAKDVEDNGIAIGNFNSKLLQKVEELTLYIIDLKKENEQLKQRITKLENK